MVPLLRSEVDRLTVVCRDQRRARAVAGAVRSADPHPRGMPSRAVLIVQHARGTADPRDPGIRVALEDAWSGARRPWDGPVGDAPAVWFADEVELVAALLLDIALGSADRWWWQRVRARLGRDLAGVMVAAPRQVPGALRRLDRLRSSDAVLDALTDGDARTVAAAVALAHGARSHDVATVVDTARQAEDRSRARGRGGAAPGRQLLELVVWRSSGAPLGVEPAFARLAGALRTGEPIHTVLAGHGVGGSVSATRWAVTDTLGTHQTDTLGSHRLAVRGTERDEAGVSSPPAGAAAGHGPRAARPPSSRTGSAAEAMDAAGRPASGSPPDTGTARSATESPDEAASRSPADTGHGGAAGVDSALAGIVFLVSVLDQLPRPLVPPGWDTDAIGGGGLLALVARGVLGDLVGDEQADPVWRLLAEIDGRDPRHEPWPGIAAGPATLPPSWSARDDTAATASAAPTSVPTPTPLPGLPPGPGLLASLVGGHVATRLAARLGPHTAAPPARLLRQRGHVHVGAIHLDVTFPIDELWLPARLAALDVDPGWVPWLGRVVLVHYR